VCGDGEKKTLKRDSSPVPRGLGFVFREAYLGQIAACTQKKYQL